MQRLTPLIACLVETGVLKLLLFEKRRIGDITLSSGFKRFQKQCSVISHIHIGRTWDVPRGTTIVPVYILRDAQTLWSLPSLWLVCLCVEAVY
jgi:hypothetical protein